LTHAIAPARDAATVLLLRDGAAGLEVFMVKRNTMVDFMAGAHVFPGGKVDAEDAALAPRLRGGIAAGVSAAHYAAAIRETREEAGVLLDYDADGLVAWTRWVTPAISPKRFDAVFFLAAAPAGQEARHDDGETTESLWIRPAAALERVQDGGMMIAPATYKCLCALAEYRDVAQALAAARASPPRVWCPVVKQEHGRRFVILSDDPQHPDHYQRMPGPTRMVFEGGRFLPA
jgi:8-oxo-dGTP pyrophosphatase MutT (NUDIX family)